MGFLGKAILLIAMFFLGISLLPFALSTFAGQHSWYASSLITSQVSCYKCHPEEYSQLASSTMHKSLTCTSCHLKYHGGDYVSVECIVCHQSQAEALNSSHETHKGFYEMTSSRSPNGNEACIMCHTHTGFNITFKRQERIEFTVTVNHTHKWTFGNLTAYGTNYTCSNATTTITAGGQEIEK